MTDIFTTLAIVADDKGKIIFTGGDEALPACALLATMHRFRLWAMERGLDGYVAEQEANPLSLHIAKITPERAIASHLTEQSDGSYLLTPQAGMILRVEIDADGQAKWFASQVEGDGAGIVELQRHLAEEIGEDITSVLDHSFGMFSGENDTREAMAAAYDEIVTLYSVQPADLFLLDPFVLDAHIEALTAHVPFPDPALLSGKLPDLATIEITTAAQ